MLAVASPSSKSLAVVWRKLLLLAAPAEVAVAARASASAGRASSVKAERKASAERDASVAQGRRVDRIGCPKCKGDVKEAWLFRSLRRRRRSLSERVGLDGHAQLFPPADQLTRREQRAIGNMVGAGAVGLVAGPESVERRIRQPGDEPPTQRGAVVGRLQRHDDRRRRVRLAHV